MRTAVDDVEEVERLLTLPRLRFFLRDQLTNIIRHLSKCTPGLTVESPGLTVETGAARHVKGEIKQVVRLTNSPAGMRLAARTPQPRLSGVRKTSRGWVILPAVLARLIAKVSVREPGASCALALRGSRDVSVRRIESLSESQIADLCHGNAQRDDQFKFKRASRDRNEKRAESGADR